MVGIQRKKTRRKQKNKNPVSCWKTCRQNMSLVANDITCNAHQSSACRFEHRAIWKRTNHTKLVSSMDEYWAFQSSCKNSKQPEIRIHQLNFQTKMLGWSFLIARRMKRNNLRLDINIAHLLSCDGLLLQQYVSSIPNDNTHLLST